MGASLPEVVSYVGAGIFGVVALFLLYTSWRFMSSIGAREYHRQQQSASSRRESRKRAKMRSHYDGIPFAGSTSASTSSGHHYNNKDSMGRSLHRKFHLYVMACVYGTALLLVALFYLIQSTGVMYYSRPSDGLEINPWRWLLLAPLSVSLTVGTGSMFINHYILDLGIVASLASTAYVLLGIAMLLALGSGQFWVMMGTSIALVLVAWLFLYGRNSTRASRRYSIIFFLLVNVAYYVLYSGSNEVFAWFGRDLTMILYLVLDALVTILPIIVIMTRWFYTRFGTPLLPLVVYQSYGVAHWWSYQTSTELHDMWPHNLRIIKHNSHVVKLHAGATARTTENGEADLGHMLSLYTTCSVCGHPEKVGQKHVHKKKGGSTDAAMMGGQKKSGVEGSNDNDEDSSSESSSESSSSRSGDSK